MTTAAPPGHSPPQTASKHQILFFDAVRALSAQIVLVGHSLNIFVPATFMVLRGGHYRPGHGIFYMQNLGVLLFFVLSGFLVSRSALSKMRSPTWGYGDYLLERVARIFVPFVPVVLLVSVADRLVLGGHDTPFIRLDLDRWTVVTNLTMLYNNRAVEFVQKVTGLPLDTRPIGSAAPFWSVVIEFWIYIFFGLLLLRVLRDRRLGVLGLGALLVAGAVVLDTVQHHKGLVMAWCVGLAYAVLTSRTAVVHRSVHRVVGVAGLVLAVLLLRRGDWNVYDEGVALALGCGVLSSWLGFTGGATSTSADLAQRRRPVRTTVTYLSDSSYSLYLVHFSILIYLQTVPWLAARPLVAVPFAFVVANGAAVAYWYAVERHYPAVRRLVRRSGWWPAVPPRRAGGSTVGGTGTRG